MSDFEARELVAYAILSALSLAVVIGILVYRRQAYWRRLRMSGSAEAKRRELDRRR